MATPDSHAPPPDLPDDAEPASPAPPDLPAGAEPVGPPDDSEALMARLAAAHGRDAVLPNRLLEEMQQLSSCFVLATAAVQRVLRTLATGVEVPAPSADTLIARMEQDLARACSTPAPPAAAEP